MLTSFKPITSEWSRCWTVVAILLVASTAVFLVGCGSNGESADASGREEPGVAVLEIETPLRAPVWSPQEEALFALGQGDLKLDGRSLTRVDITGGGFTPDEQRPEAIASSEELEGPAGENLALEKDREPDKIYVPVPGQGEVYVFEKDDLLEVRTFEAGESPSRVALYPSPDVPRTLLALSEDGSTVTAVDLLAEKEVFKKIQVNVGQGAHIGTSEDRAAEDEEKPGFWVAGSDAIAFYGGPPFERVARMPIDAEALAVGEIGSGNAYVSEASSSRLVAIGLTPNGDLEVIAEAEVNGRVMYLEAEEKYLYALTSSRLLVLDARSLKTLQTVDFDRSLDRKSLSRAKPSGLAVGEDALYLTLEGEPFLVQIEKL